VEYKPNQNCSDINYNNKIQTTVFLSLAQFIMHVVPISIVLYIYSPSIEDRKKDENILNATFTATESEDRENEKDKSLV
jgi:nitric oxide reductase large subunit